MFNPQIIEIENDNIDLLVERLKLLGIIRGVHYSLDELDDDMNEDDKITYTTHNGDCTAEVA